MHDGLDPTTIIFALLAIFVVWKLKTVLGARVDIEKRPPGPAVPPPPPSSRDAGNVVRLPGAADQAAGVRTDRSRADLASFATTEKGRTAISEIVDADPSFDAARFIAGAKMAYEMIVSAFADGDKKTLANLLSPEVLASFAAEIDERARAGEKAATKVVAIDAIDVAEGAVKNGAAQVSLRISAKMINVVRNQSGEVVSGDPDLVVSTDDLWTFSRLIASQDPTWRLIATESDPHS